ncbi:MAG: sigma-70 family RNA polymerase sigma factor [Bacteroidetes bacterium]|nr:sigma-70 family RNA polymerase sigma factor [Rhodothermia bacterium]MCS7155939.1 sigma-70 family RNA polymerase sigma factor [Bacteroidota bacterium]MCX7905945.1 sigma-70 family RNA polymerase sigma factor [Bacteroidota bacterium]MDW8138088.1 sigma-70 family RNA polymerase sigma factor [Bacteroidota bacterium]MDW8285772.1 sigma-70 family RNA polymerase sigma factor [Bacteroidota bacterium]
MESWLLSELERRVRRRFPDLAAVGRACERYRNTGDERLRADLWEWTYYWIVRFFASRLDRTAWPSQLEAMIDAALERVRRGFAQLRYPQAYPAWVNRICLNVWYSAHRSPERLPEPLYPEERDMPIEEPERDQQFDETEVLKVLAELIEALPPLQREIARLHVYYGYGLKEIAERLRMLPGTVRVYWHRIVQHLRRHPRLRPWLEEGWTP